MLIEVKKYERIFVSLHWLGIYVSQKKYMYTVEAVHNGPVLKCYLY